jgi:hypothetical protein
VTFITAFFNSLVAHVFSDTTLCHFKRLWLEWHIVQITDTSALLTYQLYLDQLSDGVCFKHVMYCSVIFIHVIYEWLYSIVTDGVIKHWTSYIWYSHPSLFWGEERLGYNTPNKNLKSANNRIPTKLHPPGPKIFSVFFSFFLYSDTYIYIYIYMYIY